MWSASSSTVTSTPDRSAWPWPMRSSSRPGQAMSTSTPRREGLDLRVLADAAEHDRAGEAGGLGERLRRRPAPGWRARGSGRAPARAAWRGRRAPPVSRATSGRLKASVLPLPVRPRPSTSRPARRVGERRDLDREGRVDALAASDGDQRAGRRGRRTCGRGGVRERRAEQEAGGVGAGAGRQEPVQQPGPPSRWSAGAGGRRGDLAAAAPTRVGLAGQRRRRGCSAAVRRRVPPAAGAPSARPKGARSSSRTAGPHTCAGRPGGARLRARCRPLRQPRRAGTSWRGRPRRRRPSRALHRGRSAPATVEPPAAAPRSRGRCR